jgi:septum site-determining protein MinD
MLAVAGGKGGCGKTTTTLGLAAALVRQRKSAVAVDADREMPNLHAMAGVEREPGLDAVADGWPAGFVAGTAGEPVLGVEVLPAGQGRATRNATDHSQPHQSHRSHSRTIGTLARVRNCADAVLLDCPAGAGPDAVAPLRVADATVVVTTAEPACLRDAVKTTAMARELDVPVAGAVVSRGPAVEEMPEGVARLLDCPVLGVVPDANEGVHSESGPASRTDPLAVDGVRATHDRILSALQPKYL